MTKLYSPLFGIAVSGVGGGVNEPLPKARKFILGGASPSSARTILRGIYWYFRHIVQGVQYVTSGGAAIHSVAK